MEDKYLEWFVKNPSCGYIHLGFRSNKNNEGKSIKQWYPIIPKEESKQDTVGKQFYETADMTISVIRPNQETIEEAAEKEFPLIDTEWCRTGACEEENLQLLGHRRSFIKGAKWQQEQDKNKYSEEEVESIWKFALYSAEQHDKFGTKNKSYFIKKDIEEFIEQFKKK
jgi:hypothetical protein